MNPSSPVWIANQMAQQNAARVAISPSGDCSSLPPVWAWSMFAFFTVSTICVVVMFVYMIKEIKK